MEEENLVPTPKELKEYQLQLEVKLMNSRTPSGLLVIDLQKDWCAPDGKAATRWNKSVGPTIAIVPKIQELIKYFRALEKPVIWTQVFENLEERSVSDKRRFYYLEGMDKTNGIAALRNTSGSNLILQPAPQDLIITKTAPSALINTNMAEIIVQKGLKIVYLVGVKTNTCVFETYTQMCSTLKDIQIILLKDLVATDDGEMLHTAFLIEMERMRPPLLTSNRLVQTWREQNPRLDQMN